MADSGAYQDYADYLEALHRGRETPAEVIAAAVRTATGSEVATTTRIIAGEVNEVYDLTTQAGDAVIVRISAKLGNLLLKERWAIEAAGREGVPVPTVLYTETVAGDTSPLTISIQRKLTGVSLDNRSPRPPDEDRRYLKQMVVAGGALLTKVHGVRTRGFGYTNASGEGANRTWREVFRRRIERPDACLEVARRRGLDEAIVERAFEEIERHAAGVSEVEPRLIHGDFGPKHIFVDGERITGIIDWGEARSDDRVEDFAWWNFWFRDEAPLAWLIEGYEDRSVFDSTFERRLYVVQLSLGLSCLEYYDGQGYEWGIEWAIGNLREMLRAHA